MTTTRLEFHAVRVLVTNTKGWQSCPTVPEIHMAPDARSPTCTDNGIQILSWFSDPLDQKLLDLVPILQTMSSTEVLCGTHAPCVAKASIQGLPLSDLRKTSVSVMWGGGGGMPKALIARSLAVSGRGTPCVVVADRRMCAQWCGGSRTLAVFDGSGCKVDARAPHSSLTLGALGA